jgi:hypothetical protein
MMTRDELFELADKLTELVIEYRTGSVSTPFTQREIELLSRLLRLEMVREAVMRP